MSGSGNVKNNSKSADHSESYEALKGSAEADAVGDKWKKYRDLLAPNEVPNQKMDSGGNMNMQDFFSTRMELMKRTQAAMKRTAQLAAFVPDYILKEEGQKIPYQTSLDGVVVIADVSGFTALTEKYSLKGKGGTDQLTKTLSNYMGPLAECILQAGGDIIKYAGDAILAVWKVAEKSQYYAELQRVVDCTLYIQEKYGSYDTDVGITIRVKLGIGAGRIFQCGVGNQDYHHFVTFGPGVMSASEAEHHCESGEVIMQLAAWEHCTPIHFNYAVKETGFMRIHEIYTFVSPEMRGRPVVDLKLKNTVKIILPTTDQIRPAIAIALEKKTEGQLRHYVIPPVLKKLDDDIPLEYLNESRQTCICFIKIEIRPFEAGVTFVDAMLFVVQSAFKEIYRIGLIMGGCLTKIIMFDKGLTYLVVFGLPGYLHDNQSANALKFSYRVKSLLQGIKWVDEVSLGVTSGTTYCGVLGHERRQEYTVIGRKVNKAARLMCYYPGKVTCDQDTLYHSKLPVHHFSLMEAKELKGIKDVGNIYEYLSSETTEDQSVKIFDYPMLGRDSEIRYFSAILDGVEAEFARFLQAHRIQDVVYDLRTTKEVTAAGLWMLVFESDIGMGKSRLLAACIQEAEKRGSRVFSVTMNMMLGTQGLACIRSLLLQAFGMEDMRTTQEREEHLRRMTGEDADLAAGLCLLNTLLGLKFSMHPRYATTEMNSRHVLSMHILNVLIRHFYPETLVLFVVDDAHQMEPLCWEYLLHMSRTPAMIVLLSIRRNSSGAPKLSEAVSKVIYHNKNVKSVRLNGLDTSLSLPLACQMIEVAGLPVELERILVNKSQGNPAWIEQVLSEMLRTGLIKILHYDLREAGKRGMKLSTVDLKYIARIEYVKQTGKNKAYAWHSEDVTEAGSSDNLFGEGPSSLINLHQINTAVRVQKALIRPETRMCVVKSDTNISSAPIPGTLKEMLLDAFDELNSSEQMLLKSASALGFRFCRAMLIELVPLYEGNARKYQVGLRRLMELKMIKCASAPHKSEIVTNDINCFCRITKDDLINQRQDEKNSFSLEDETRKPKYYRCKYMQFSKDNLLEVVYELMTEDQRKELHLKAARYLASSNILCRVCGGEETSYIFGFTLKGVDIGGDHEEALRTAATQGRRKQFFQGPKSSRRSTGANSDTSGSIHLSSRRAKSLSRRGTNASNSNKIDNVKKIYQSSGTKVGGIEVEILKTVEKFEKLQKERERIKWPCDKKNSGKKHRLERRAEAREFDLQVKMLEKMDEEQEIGAGDDLKEGQKYDKRSLSAAGGGERPPIMGGMAGRRDVVDFRGCGCNNIQAKIAIDLVKHYHIAEKFGKCLTNLLAASETAIAIGNSTQALVHLEDAVALMHALDTLELTPPKPDDIDDAVVNAGEVNIQIEFLTGLSYFELGVQHKARDYFCRSLRRYGIDVPSDDEKVKRNAAIMSASQKLWRRHNCPCLIDMGMTGKEEQTTQYTGGSMDMKLRIFSYLHTMYKAERRMDMALLISLWQLIAAQDSSGAYQDVLPAYCNLMDMYSAMSNHKQASNYEKYALRIIRTNFGSDESQNALGIYTSANVFLTISAIRTLRGDLNSGVDSAYLALRIASTMHDNALAIQVFPRLISSLLFCLRISEVIECLQRLWYTTEEEDDKSGVAMYYTLCLELLLNTAYPMEPFYTCENFVATSDWNADTAMNRTYEVQYHIEASLALWHSRYSRWEGATKWKTQAELHRPKVTSYLSVGGELKLLECELIFVNHYLDSKRYQHFAKSRNTAKTYMRSLQKSTVSAPVFLPRFLHLMGYYCRIRSRNVDCEKHLKKAEEVAKEHGNELEREWIAHNRNVWNDEAIPSVRFFWLEHTEHHTLDWHQSGTVPWANIMFSLPIPEWQS